MSSLKNCVKQSTKQLVDFSKEVLSDERGVPSSTRVILIWAMGLFTWTICVWSWMCFVRNEWIPMDWGPLGALVAAVTGKTVQSFAERRNYRDREDE